MGGRGPFVQTLLDMSCPNGLKVGELQAALVGIPVRVGGGLRLSEAGKAGELEFEANVGSGETWPERDANPTPGGEDCRT